MITETLYVCEICRQRYPTREMAERCEARGPGREYPIGMIYGLCDRDLVFAIISNNVQRHSNWPCFWVTRDNGASDTLGVDSICGGSSLDHPCPPNPETPAFRRMIKFLRSRSIDITVWDGEKPVSLNNWMQLVSGFRLTPMLIEKAKGWDGYVDPRGQFYRTKPSDTIYWNGSCNCHTDWADIYYMVKGVDPDSFRGSFWIDQFGQKNEILTAEDHLVNVERWASCAFNCGGYIYITPPRLEKGLLTTAQKETIFKLFALNGYPMDVYYEQCEVIVPE